MLEFIKTLEEARKCKYGFDEGWSYQEGYCAFHVLGKSGKFSYQCSRKNGHGVNGLYCKQHAKYIEKYYN